MKDGPEGMDIPRERSRSWSAIRRLPAAGRSLLSAAGGLLLALASAAGCGGPGYDVVPVAGKVRLDGTPKAGVHVSFQPQAASGSVNPGPGSYGLTDAEGRYHLLLVEPPGEGAVVGTHRVRFLLPGAKADPTDDRVRPAAAPLPERYTNGSLQFTVPPGGSGAADFDLLTR
jgi:hypothetical protein